MSWPGWEFTVLEMDKNRIDKVLARPVSEEEAERIAMAGG